MKRRKKLWIACAALAVVVVLCALALFYRPLPYRFLSGATMERASTGGTLMGTLPAVERTFYSYRVPGKLDTVVADARRELTPENGWDWFLARHEIAACRNAKGSELINFEQEERITEGDPWFVTVNISHETTLNDRVIVWLHNR